MYESIPSKRLVGSRPVWNDRSDAQRHIVTQGDVDCRSFPAKTGFSVTSFDVNHYILCAQVFTTTTCSVGTGIASILVIFENSGIAEIAILVIF